MPSQAAETGANQRLPPDGGGVHQESGADEASGGETGGQPLLQRVMANFVSLTSSRSSKGGEVKGG